MSLTTQSFCLSPPEPVVNVIVTPWTADVAEFSSVSAFCSFSGSSLSFLWMKGSSEITTNDRIQLNRTDGGSYLTILSVTQYDQGTYTCQVSNPVSSKKDSMTLLVNYGPENTQLSVSPSKEHHEKGSDITLSCSSESRPPAEFTWFLNGDKMPHSDPELKLMKVQTNQSGNYTCRAFNHITKRDQKSQTRSPVHDVAAVYFFSLVT
uniref:Ig-like domain-containing protein n=1 Tax=Fundulus heteroclitus TaxID=8078 RepID=A0A3Q2PYS3_FUNHE